MSKYCCFFCPTKDQAEKDINDKCKTCGRSYAFPLESAPKNIGEYRITKPLDRGFYGAAYIAERGAFARKYVVKICPVAFYTFFQKTPFSEEAALHARVAESADHIVDIVDASDQVVTFSDSENTTILCHVTILEHIDGHLLRDFLSGDQAATPADICQIAVDLLRIREEFESHQLHHNDLHAENLIVERLRPESRRANAISDSIRVKAIDLGSVADGSKSNETRLGDLRHIASHVDLLLARLTANPASLSDRDFRISLALQAVVHGVQSDAIGARLPNIRDLISQIREAFDRASHPWKPWTLPFQLRGFGDHYNAQTLESWNVPKLLVDPENRWLSEISVAGPQVITGMRGCGKTMLLRALDLHARAAPRRENEPPEDILERLRADGFVGLFVSAQRLLDLRPQSLTKVEHRLSRLFINYSLQAARALLHIRDVSAEAVSRNAHEKMANAICNYLDDSDDIRLSSSIEDLERRLTEALVLAVRDPSRYGVRAAPTEAFIHLAKELVACAVPLQTSTVLFLLDDVSTRYLEVEKVGELLSALMFQSPQCAFKFTSEWQTIELGLKSPGREHPAREGRDLTVFDLGADVLRTINTGGDKGPRFVSEILIQRARLHPSHPRMSRPSDVLGNVSLEQVAREIASAQETSDQRKRAYRGLSCLTNVCVGDLGDVIKLYEEITRRAPHGPFPISSDIQSECFHDLGTRRLYDLNRRNGYFKDHALAFAEAAHELLRRSHRIGKKAGDASPRLRQYSTIYVRITTDDKSKVKQQIDTLRELIDASVFVFAGGAPRMKTKDSNPIQHFILSFRKIYGLTSYIGLGDRDRFELSGEDLEEWLSKPATAKTILLRNQVREEPGESRDAVIHEEGALRAEGADVRTDGLSSGEPNPNEQRDLFSQPIAPPVVQARRATARPLGATIRNLDDAELQNIRIEEVLIGLGFEDRTLAASEHLAGLVSTGRVRAVRYSMEGHARRILDAWKKTSSPIVEVSYSGFRVELPQSEGLVLVDISGLAKPLIFNAIRRELISKRRVLICHAGAKTHYPLQEDLAQVIAAKQSEDTSAFLDQLARVLTGERGPYKEQALIEDSSDPTRNRALLAFASPKHERLFSLLDRREFDQIEIITSNGVGSRATVSGFAADFIAKNYPNTAVTSIDTDDLVGLVRYLDKQYLEIYGEGGANLELGLTGSKVQAVACAILSARRKIAQAWYVSPKEFDEKRFSTGVSQIRVYEIALDDLSPEE